MRLIDGDALVKQLLYEMQADTDKSIQTTLAKNMGMVFCKIIDAQPTIEEHKTGWWMTLERGEHGYSSGDFKCSVCGGPNRCYSLTKYCANCGARMKEGTD